MRPPSLFRACLRWCVTEEERDLVREMDGLYAERVARSGRASARLWYLRQVLGMLLRVGLPGVLHHPLGNGAGMDVRVACRTLRRHRAFALTFLSTLAIGTAGVATVYSAARWVMLRPVPGVLQPDSLVHLRLGGNGAPAQVTFDISDADYRDLRDALGGEARVTASAPLDAHVQLGDARAVRMPIELIRSNYFAVLGVPLHAGRSFGASDDTPPPGPSEIVVSHGLARLLADEAATALGREVQVNGHPFRVIGVTAPGFGGAELPANVRAWLPLSALDRAVPGPSAASVQHRYSGIWSRILVRPLSGGAEQVGARANAVMETIRKEHTSHSFPARMQVMQAYQGAGLAPAVRAPVQRTVRMMTGVALFMLLLTSANLANLVLGHAARLRGEAAVRAALGAGRLRLLRGDLMQGMVLGVTGSMLALLLARLGIRWTSRTRLAEHGALLDGVQLDGHVLLLTVAVAAFVAVLAAVYAHVAETAPAIEARLRRSARSFAGSERVRSLLVGVQVTVSMLLVLCAALLGRTLHELRSVDMGFAPDGLVTFALDPGLNAVEPDEFAARSRDLLERLRADHAVHDAATISPTPFRSSYVTSSVYLGPDGERPDVVGAGYFVSAGLLQTLGAHTIAGDASWPASPGTAVLSATMADALFPDAPPASLIGRVIYSGRSHEPVRISAILADVRLSWVFEAPPPTIFRSQQDDQRLSSPSIIVRADAPAATLQPAIESAVAAALPGLPPFDLRTVRAAIDLQYSERLALGVLVLVLAAISILLAAVGLYGVLAHAVAARTRELGIRTALGAAPRDIAQLVLQRGLALGLVGAIAGMICGLLATPVLRAYIWGIQPFEYSTYLLGLLLVLTVCVLACIPPIISARRVDPLRALRTD